MGQSREKRIRFFELNPICCFCGGNTLATTIDHIPSRACFSGKIGPDGYEFPACDGCQTRLRQEEQFFAFMCHLSDRDNSNYDNATSRKLMMGIRNNLPHLYPSIVKGANARRRGLRNFGIPKPIGKTLDELPMVDFPKEIDPIIRKVATKIGLALYYKHKGRVAAASLVTSSFWGQAANRLQMEDFSEVVKSLHSFQKTSRRNIVNFGDRFTYAWGDQDEGEPDIFVCVAKFGNGMVILTMIADLGAANDDDANGWLRVEEFGCGDFPKHWLNLSKQDF